MNFNTQLQVGGKEHDIHSKRNGWWHYLTIIQNVYYYLTNEICLIVCLLSSVLIAANCKHRYQNKVIGKCVTARAHDWPPRPMRQMHFTDPPIGAIGLELP